MTPLQITPRLVQIPLDQRLPGFQSFISAWLYRNDTTILVDPGPSSTIGLLISTLAALGVKALDAILITHIHIDHAGGAGDLHLRFPDTPIFCHEKARKHLVSPTRLWEGSLKTLGDTARAYGPMRPVAEKYIFEAGLADRLGITALDTPGHAPHHSSYLVEGILFAGEAGGVFYDGIEGAPYLRPATPPRFFLETSVNSLNLLIDTPHELYCYGHFGCTKSTPELLTAHKRQLLRWRDVIADEKKRDSTHGLARRCLQRLIHTDPLLGAFDLMPEAVQARERYFLTNSIRGFIGYLEEDPARRPS